MDKRRWAYLVAALALLVICTVLYLVRDKLQGLGLPLILLGYFLLFVTARWARRQRKR